MIPRGKFVPDITAGDELAQVLALEERERRLRRGGHEPCFECCGRRWLATGLGLHAYSCPRCKGTGKEPAS